MAFSDFFSPLFTATTPKFQALLLYNSQKKWPPGSYPPLFFPFTLTRIVTQAGVAATGGTRGHLLGATKMVFKSIDMQTRSLADSETDKRYQDCKQAPYFFFHLTLGYKQGDAGRQLGK